MSSIPGELDQVRAPDSPDRKAWAIVLGVAISAAAVYALLGKVDWRHIFSLATQARWSLLALNVPIGIAAMVLLGSRTRVMCGAGCAMSLRSQTFGHYYAFLGNSVLPLRIGELLRIDYVAKQSGFSVSRVVAILALERVLDASFMLACFAISAISSTALSSFGIGMVLTSVVTISLFLLFVWAARFPGQVLWLAGKVVRPLGGKVAGFMLPRLQAFVDGLEALRRSGSFTNVLALTCLRWALALVAIEVWFGAFEINLPWFASLLVLSFLTFGTMIPSSVASVGTYHYAVVTALGLLSVAPERALAVAIVAHAVTFAPPTVIAATWIASRAARGETPWNKKLESQSEDS